MQLSPTSSWLSPTPADVSKLGDGRFYMIEGKWKEATEYFTKMQKKDPHYVEAAFYAGLGYAKLGELGHALAALVPLSTDMPLIGVYNNAGAVAVQAAREEKKAEERARLLAQGTSFLARASVVRTATDPSQGKEYQPNRTRRRARWGC